jgi:hypothetical protein
MKEVKKVETALRTIERLEEYVFRRALGATFIVWAVIIAVAGFVGLKAEAIARAIELSPSTLIGFTLLVALLAGASLTAYLFISAGRFIGWKKSVAVPSKKRLVGVAIGLVWFILTFVAGWVGAWVGHAITWPICIGLANVLTYALTRVIGRGYIEWIIIGVILLAASPLIFFTEPVDLAYMIALAVVVLAYGIGGICSLLAATEVLIKKKEFQHT